MEVIYESKKGNMELVSKKTFPVSSFFSLFNDVFILNA